MSQEILFLDLATQMGFCEGAPGEQPRYGSHRLGTVGAENEEVFGGLLKWLGQKLLAFPPRLVVYEAPMLMLGGGMAKSSNIVTVERLVGLTAVAQAVCYGAKVPVRRANVQTIRKHFLGVARPENPKKAVIDRCRLLGYAPKDDNAADAIAGWDYACAIVDKRTSARSTPLFGRAEG